MARELFYVNTLSEVVDKRLKCDSFQEAINRQEMRGMGELNFIQVRTLALSIPPFSTQKRGGRACLAAFPGEQGESGHFLLSQVKEGKAAHSPRAPAQCFLTIAHGFAEHKPTKSRESQKIKMRQCLDSYSYLLRHRRRLSVHLLGLKQRFSWGKNCWKGTFGNARVFGCLNSGLG